MLLTPPLISVFKYAFLGLVATSAGFLIAHTAITMQYESEATEPLAYRSRPSPKNESLALDRNSIRCLTHPSRPFCQMSHRKKLRLLKNRLATEESGNVSREPHPNYLLMKDFMNLTRSLGVDAVLLEPALLFCMLSTLQKYYLVSNDLHADSLRDSNNLITFGIFENDAKILNQENSVKQFLEMGYELSSSGKWLRGGDNSTDATYFLTRHNVTMMMMVLFLRDEFLYHPEVQTGDNLPSPKVFQRSQAFEKFIAVPHLLDDWHQSGFLLPSEMNHFLLQIQRSEYIECPLSTDSETSTHQSLSFEQLSQRALIAIQETKAILRPMMGTFWLWNETLSGWNESCNIFKKTSEFQIAVPAELLSKLKLNDTFLQSEYLRPLHIQQWEDLYLQLVLDCFGLRVSIAAVYEDHDSMWSFEKNSTGYLIKNTYAKFELCSTSVMGQLVQKPCSRQSHSI